MLFFEIQFARYSSVDHNTLHFLVAVVIFVGIFLISFGGVVAAQAEAVAVLSLLSSLFLLSLGTRSSHNLLDRKRKDLNITL